MNPLPTQTDPVVAPSRKRVWLRRALELLLMFVVIMGVRAWQQRDIVSGAAPALQGALLDMRPFALPARPEHPVLVHFWATWCPICRTEQGSIDKLAGEGLAGGHFKVVTVALQSGTRESVGKFMSAQKLRFPVLNDPEGAISSAWGVHTVPASFVIDTDGKIRFVEVGYTTEIGLRLRLWLAQF